MGLFDLFKSDPNQQALRAAQERRRSANLAPRRKYKSYERLEKIITKKAGKFPWGRTDAVSAAGQVRIAPAHIEAYLNSDAAKRLR